MNRKVFTLIMFAVLVFLLGARAATAQWISLPKASEIVNSVSSFFPVIFKNYSAASPIPRGVLFVFSSTATTDGDAGGRSGIQQICPNEDLYAHFCSVYEIENEWVTNGILFSDPIPQSWVDYPESLGILGASSASISWGSSANCEGWSSSTDGDWGTAISTSAAHLIQTNCQTTLPVACCKNSAYAYPPTPTPSP